MQLLSVDMNGELKRLKRQRQTLKAQARGDQINLSALAMEIYDELVSLQSQLVAFSQASTSAVDGAFQYGDELADHVGYDPEEFTDDGDEDGDDDGPGAPRSFLLVEDAKLIESAIVRAGVTIMEAKEGKEVDWDVVLRELDAARIRVDEVRQPPPSQASH